ncbi:MULTISPECIES: porin family protein [unclassified Polaribacter]|uniref:porin family protein n=1 Tax=unclassified Polaribacter TaxID=196858 RepID=UPI0011BEDD32|nr:MULTISPECIES: porin family protein [unclassified Polaribacter]TXD52860.1 PorT family protein [Polaribacter sp. IC063]TXD60806.1 PorT family protein [Polaribacter sp. IC066]
MKKVLLIAVIALLSLSNVNAQDVKFGAKTGLNFSNFTGDVEDAKTKIGFNIGAFVEIGLSDKFTFQPELLFSTQGAKSEDSEGSDSFEQTIKANYLNVPLMLKYAVSDKFALEFGPQIGFLLSADAETTGNIEGESISVEVDVKDSFKSIDFGLNFGASFDIVENVFIGARYNLGLSNIIDSEDMDSDDEKAQNSVFSVSVGYRF